MPADLKAAEPTLSGANALTASGDVNSFTVTAKSRGDLVEPSSRGSVPGGG